MRTPAFIISAVLLTHGCGTIEETTESTEQSWTAAQDVAATARLEYRIDSLMNENRRLRQQVDAMAAETRSLNARNAELEMKLAEAAAPPVVAPPVTAAPPPKVTPTPSPAPAKPPADHTAGYSAALAEYRNRNFTGAVAQFEALLKAGIREDLADNCHYWIGESYYGLGQYGKAVEHFTMVLKYTRSEKKEDAQMMIGNAHLANRNPAAAKEAYNTLINTYPSSQHVRRAQERLAGIK